MFASRYDPPQAERIAADLASIGSSITWLPGTTRRRWRRCSEAIAQEQQVGFCTSLKAAELTAMCTPLA